MAIVCLLGVASLLPWNILITQAQYLTVRAHRDTDPSGSWWADQIESLTANFYLFFNLAAFLVLLPLGKYVSIHSQISIPLLISAVITLLQAYIAYDVRLSGSFFIGSTLISTALLGAATAPMTSATYALASFLPPVYIQARQRNINRPLSFFQKHCRSQETSASHVLHHAVLSQAACYIHFASSGHRFTAYTQDMGTAATSPVLEGCLCKVT